MCGCSQLTCILPSLPKIILSSEDQKNQDKMSSCFLKYALCYEALSRKRIKRYGILKEKMENKFFLTRQLLNSSLLWKNLDRESGQGN